MEKLDKRFLLDFEVESDGSFPDDSTVIHVRHPEGLYDLEISNLSVAPGTDLPLLSVHLVIAAEDYKSAQEKGRSILSGVLQLLTFLTSLGYRMHKLVRVVDWTPGLTERLCVQYASTERHDTPHPVLAEEIFKSLETLERVPRSDLFQRALRWFSLGVRSRFKDEQFQFFWFVLELLSQANKLAVEVADKCPRCQHPLYCEACGERPTHRPYPKQLIQALMMQIAPKHPDLFTAMNKIRNRLSHGDSVENIEASLKIILADEVDKLGKIAWHAVYRAFIEAFPDRSRPINIHTIETSGFVHQTLVMGAHLLFHSRDPANPKIDEVPKTKVTIETRVNLSPKASA